MNSIIWSTYLFWQLIVLISLVQSQVLQKKKIDSFHIGQFIVDTNDGADTKKSSIECDLVLKSETPIRVIDGCFRASIETIRACDPIKYYREIGSCCVNPRIELTSSLFAAANAEKTRCYRIQEYIYNYCIKIPTYRLDVGCAALTGCGTEFALTSRNTTGQTSNVTDQLHNRQCHDVTVNKYKGAILSDCHRLIGQVGERQSHCIYVKRTLPHRACCNEDNGAIAVDQLDDQPHLLPCTKFQEVESKFCFDVPVEQREQCNRQLISDKCPH